VRGGYLNAGISPCDVVNVSIERVCDPLPELTETVKAAPANSSSKTKLYHVVVDTDGVHKGMTVIDPSGDDFEKYQQSCRCRFGADRIISIEPRP
jgi:hypothetical protein